VIQKQKRQAEWTCLGVSGRDNTGDVA
jgi:hypothetical protein